MSDQKKSDLVPIAPLWTNTTKEGAPYLRGYLGNALLLIFKNKYKEKDSDPDWRAYVAPRAPKEKKDDVQDPMEKELRSGISADVPPPIPENVDDEIPF